MKNFLLGLSLLTSATLAACGPGGTGDDSPAGGSGGEATASGGSSPSGGTSGSGAGGSSGGGGDTANGGSASGGEGSGGGSPVLPLPEGSTETLGILNLVDAEAYEQLASYVRGEADATLAPLAQRFYEFYPDEYDFLVFVTDTPLPDTPRAAAFATVNRPAIPGTGIDQPLHQAGYGSRGRLKGVAGAQGDVVGGMPPFDHELIHYWGAYLSPELGFQYDPDFDITSHWGYVSVHGQLGGFDAATLRCVVPDGALPPACTPESDGSTQYRTSAFGPNTNSFKGALFGALELYVMGLIPKEEVPPLTVLESPHYLESGEDYSIVSAEGLSEITMDDIVALHGERAPTPEDERHFELGFVLVSALPADPLVLEQVAEWAAIWGDRQPGDDTWTSFAHKTGDRMTLSTEIGRRRVSSDPERLPPPPDTCDVLAQDCGEDFVGCYLSQCLGSAEMPLGTPCVYLNDCVPGTVCVNDACREYCSAESTPSESSCETMCPGSSVSVVPPDGSATVRVCIAD